MKNRLSIEFDRDAIGDKARCEMEEALEDVLRKYGWKFTGSGADISTPRGEPRMRDIQFDKVK